jgi:hypothetical protein
MYFNIFLFKPFTNFILSIIMRITTIIFFPSIPSPHHHHENQNRNDKPKENHFLKVLDEQPAIK